MMLCLLCSWEVWALIAFGVLWFITRSFLKIDNINRKHVFITGCDSGFGRLLAEKLDAKGVHVFAGCLTEKSAEELDNKSSSKLKTVQVDVTDSKSVRKAVDFVKGELGNHALWGLVNNAGVRGAPVPFEWSTKEDCQKALNVNLLGVYDVTLAFLPLIKRGKEGRIVNISSLFGRISLSADGYTMSKYGVEAFSDGLSFELMPYNITVHTLNPGYFKTDLTRPETKIELLRQRFSMLDEEAKEQCGGEPFLEEMINYTYKTAEMTFSPKLHLVAEAYEHALFAKYPQNRYSVGLDAKLFYIPLSWLHLDLKVVILSFFQRLSGLSAPTPRNTVVDNTR